MVEILPSNEERVVTGELVQIQCMYFGYRHNLLHSYKNGRTNVVDSIRSFVVVVRCLILANKYSLRLIQTLVVTSRIEY